MGETFNTHNHSFHLSFFYQSLHNESHFLDALNTFYCPGGCCRHLGRVSAYANVHRNTSSPNLLYLRSSYSLGPAKTNIIEMSTTITPGAAPPTQAGMLFLWSVSTYYSPLGKNWQTHNVCWVSRPGISNGTGDLVQVSPSPLVVLPLLISPGRPPWSNGLTTAGVVPARESGVFAPLSLVGSGSAMAPLR